MNQIKNLKKLSYLSYFDKETLAQYIRLSDNSLYANIKRWLQQGLIIQLKKGLYVTQDYLVSRPDRDAYNEFIANRLRAPSYLSLETVLQKYGILAEAVYAWTSVTLKSRRRYQNKLGLFMYRGIKPDFFTGFEGKTTGGFRIYSATKAKALFDYLYFKLRKVRELDREWLESLRLNLDEFSTVEWKEFSGYCQTAGAKKMKRLPKLIGDMR